MKALGLPSTRLEGKDSALQDGAEEHDVAPRYTRTRMEAAQTTWRQNITRLTGSSSLLRAAPPPSLTVAVSVSKPPRRPMVEAQLRFFSALTPEQGMRVYVIKSLDG